jgi:hypothetical protein
MLQAMITKRKAMMKKVAMEVKTLSGVSDVTRNVARTFTVIFKATTTFWTLSLSTCRRNVLVPVLAVIGQS